MSASALPASALDLSLRLPGHARMETTVDYSYEHVGPWGTESRSSRARYEKVITARGDGYRVSRRLLEFRPSAQDTAMSDSFQTIVATAPARDLSYAADKNLKPLSVENWYDLSSKISNDMRVAAKGEPDRENSLTVVLSLWAMTSPADAVHVVLRNEVELFRPIGTVVEVGKSVVEEEPFAFAFDGHSIKARSVLSLESLDASRGVAVLNYSRGADPRSLKEVLAEIVSQIESDRGEPIDAATLAALQFEDTINCRYEIELKTGLPTKAKCEHKARATDMTFFDVVTRTEQWVMTQTLKN